MHADTVQTYVSLLKNARIIETMRKTPFMLVDLERVYLEIKGNEGCQGRCEGIAKETQ
jgi:hypothetical protein